ncbi:alpha-2-macroglobulin family protein [Tellurirhabdus rosea]|uniref:alpha-2-macroglobulin family protein n=1 Tax=Tellurirhabdus rosea TaxID=2674997 RepID=UPI00224F3425|nr:alpha-2-macroglobulin family protein [Tellurirhabdus rosea]
MAVTLPGRAQSAAYTRDWKRADSLAAGGQPKSALDIVGRIYADARKARNYPQVVKAAMHRLIYRSYLDESDYTDLLQSLATDIRETPAPARSVLQSVQAEIYWRYYQQNRYKFLNRSQEEPAPQTAKIDTTVDPRTWDARRLLSTVTRLYEASLSEKKLLQETPVAAFEVLLEKGDPDSRQRRPTLYDLLAHRALSFYQDTEIDLTRPVFKFSLDQPAYLSEAAAFAQTPLQTRDAESLRFQALKLFQELIRFHLAGKNTAALADVDNLRLQFVHRYSIVPGKDALYQQALERGVARYAGQPAEAEYLYSLAKLLAGNEPPRFRPLIPGETTPPQPADDRDRWNRKKAADLCRDLVQRYPQALPGRNAAALLENLTAPGLNVQVERVNQPGKPFRAEVVFRNVPRLYFRTVNVSVAESRGLLNEYDENVRRPKIANLLKRKAVTFGTVTLPEDGDLHQHRTEMPLGGVPAGHYVLLISTDEAFSVTSPLTSYTPFTASNLADLRRDAVAPEENGLYVVNRTSGQPIAGASVTLFTATDRSVRPAGTVKTTEAGLARLSENPVPENTSYFYRISFKGDTIDTDLNYHYRFPREQEEPEQRRVLLFTDRAIYRPGQPIYFKGVLYSGKNNQFEVVSGDEMVVGLTDANGESVTTQTLKTNEFGTFEGSFTAPVGRVTGQMTLQTSVGSTTFRVEEYKRPTFEVKIDSIRQAYKLEQTIAVRGLARTFSGAVVDGAQVRYRITRQRHQFWPWWEGGPSARFSRVMPPRSGTQTEIASGTLTTDATGAVSLTFVAEPDRAAARSENPVFDFEITLDVTDRAGETRSATQTLRLGYTALTASLTLPERLETTKDVSAPLRVTNAAGKPVSVRANVTVYRLKTPERLLRGRYWEAPDRYILSRTEYEKLFPNDLYANEDQPVAWPKAQAVQEAALSGREPTLTLNTSRFEPGEYVARISATDSTRETATQDVYFSVVNPQKPAASPLPDHWLTVEKETVEVGSEAVFFVGTAQPGWVLWSVAEKGRVVRQEWLPTDGTLRRIAVPVLESHRGGFVVQFAMVQNGRLLTENKTINVPFTNKRLTITTEVFRDKLKPGQPEEWTLRIDGPDKDKVLAEMAATLYDASLDAFAEHSWAQSIYNSSVGYWRSWASGAFGLNGAIALTPRDPQPVGEQSRVYDYLMLDEFLSTGEASLMRGAVWVSLNRNGAEISGKVTERGTGLPGLVVSVKNSLRKATTDRKGQFSLSLTATEARLSATVVLSLHGFRTQEITLGTRKSLTVRMKPDPAILGRASVRSVRMMKGAVARMEAPAAMAADASASEAAQKLEGQVAGVQVDRANPGSPAIAPTPQPRRNFSETAFFFPSLKTDAQGRVVLKFTMPDALTRWKLLAFAHTKDLKTGLLEKEIITQKELMITANVPRFFREGDTIRLTARINNLTDKALTGTARLDLTNAQTGEPLQGVFFNPSILQSFKIDSRKSTAPAWTLVIPAGLPPVTVRVTATAGAFSDAEEQTVPVLPNRMLVTETLPFWVNGSETKTFRLDALAKLNPELPVQHERLTVEVTSNPAWYALQSLPYLMEYPYECAEQLFGRVYANSLAAHILGSRPEFQKQIAEWKKTPPRNPLEANAELKAVTLENTPWLRDARSQTEQQAKLANLLDTDRLASEQQRAVDKLKALQSDNGGFRWFGGMQPDLTMTLHILASYGHLQKLGVKLPAAVQRDLADMLPKAVRFVDAEMKQWQDGQKKSKAAWYGYLPAQFLYARSFYTAQPLDKALLADLQTRLAAEWLSQPLQTQVLAALALHRFGTAKTPGAILTSLRERAKVSDELGMYWPENEAGTNWHQAPVETQAYAIEAFSEIAADGKTGDRLKQWLLRQKQTQAWPSTKATTEAVYALLLRGSDWLDTKPNTDVKVGGIALASRTDKAEVLASRATPGYQKATFAPAEIKPDMGRIEISRKGAGPAWGALYWQHFEPMDKVVSGSTGLTVEKTLALQKDSPNGPVVTALSPQTKLKPGDLVKVRVVVRTDRALAYVHLKDGRASGFEPVAALSGYKYQNGLSYYEAPRDASMDFFLSYLPTGTHVFEYDLRVVHAGDFTSGVATIQCFYAPEFAAHSNGGRVVVANEK